LYLIFDTYLNLSNYLATGMKTTTKFAATSHENWIESSANLNQTLTSYCLELTSSEQISMTTDSNQYGTSVDWNYYLCNFIRNFETYLHLPNKLGRLMWWLQLHLKAVRQKFNSSWSNMYWLPDFSFWSTWVLAKHMQQNSRNAAAYHTAFTRWINVLDYK
jgi:hypothetical protein